MLKLAAGVSSLLQNQTGQLVIALSLSYYRELYLITLHNWLHTHLHPLNGYSKATIIIQSNC